jgi:hypothetical protein
MATANWTLPDGSKVAIEGTADEVAVLVSRLSGGGDSTAVKRQRRTKTGGSSSGKKQERRSTGPRGLIEALAQQDYFKAQKRTIGDVQKKLEQDGHIYALNSLSPALLRLTRAKTLRRIKENKGWVYVK